MAGENVLVSKIVRPGAGKTPKANRRTDFEFDPPIMFSE
jgi:hypothetical protein